jgi:raffinose/stachyose/melibiose transport system permease protein
MNRQIDNTICILRHLAFKIVLYVFAIVYAFVSMFPLFFALYSSFKPDVAIYDKPFSLPTVLNIESYQYALQHSNVLRGIANSLTYAVLGTSLVLMFSLVLSYFITRLKIRFKNALTLYFYSSITLPIYASLIPLAVIITKLGIKNSVIGIVLLYSAMNLSFGFFFLSGYMKSIPRELDESAIIDGCGPVRLLFSIITPLSTPAIVTTAIIVGKGIYNDLIFGVLMLTDVKKYTLALSLLVFKTEIEVKVNVIFAAICMSILPLLIFYFTFQKNIEQGLTTGALKG